MSNCNDTWTGKDKVKHFGACLAIADICPIVAVLAAMGKELNDQQQPNNHFCIKDLVADAVGIALGTIIFCLWWVVW